MVLFMATEQCYDVEVHCSDVLIPVISLMLSVNLS